MDFYTSEWLSKKLHENGCEIKTDHHHVPQMDGKYKIQKGSFRLSYFSSLPEFPAYHLLEDICCLQVSEFFKGMYYRPTGYGGKNIPEMILFEMSAGNKQEAEKIFWKHCFFNPDNK